MAARPLTGQTVSGDLHMVELFEKARCWRRLTASDTAMKPPCRANVAADVLKKNAGESVISLVQRSHEALVGTRGAVMTLAAIDIRGSKVRWIGVGNVEARLFRAEASVTHPIGALLAA